MVTDYFAAAEARYRAENLRQEAAQARLAASITARSTGRPSRWRPGWTLSGRKRAIAH